MDNNEDVKKKGAFFSCGNYGSLCLVCFLSRLILGRINRFEKKRDISKSLEEEWSRSAKLKHQREDEERRFLRCVDVGHLEPPSASTLAFTSSHIFIN